MTYLIPALQRLCDTCTVMHWLFHHHNQCAGMARSSDRLRDHIILVLRAQWYGFDRNETIYLVKLFDETRGTVEQ